jgi:hypothetical protein
MEGRQVSGDGNGSNGAENRAAALAESTPDDESITAAVMIKAAEKDATGDLRFMVGGEDLPTLGYPQEVAEKRARAAMSVAYAGEVERAIEAQGEPEATTAEPPKRRQPWWRFSA